MKRLNLADSGGSVSPQDGDRALALESSPFGIDSMPSGRAGPEPLAPIEMVNRILVSDSAILGVLAFDNKGNSLAMAGKGEMPELRSVSEELGRQAAKLGSIIVGSTSQYTNLYGHLQAITFRYQTAKILVVVVPESRFSLMIRLIASANVDYIVNSVRQLLGQD